MVNDIFRNSPSCENAFGALRRARQTRNIKNNSLKYGQSAAEAIQIVFCRDICKNNARVFHLPQEGCGKTRALFLQRDQLLALVSFTILEAGSLPMAELLRVLSSWAP